MHGCDERFMVDTGFRRNFASALRRRRGFLHLLRLGWRCYKSNSFDLTFDLCLRHSLVSIVHTDIILEHLIHLTRLRRRIRRQANLAHATSWLRQIPLFFSTRLFALMHRVSESTYVQPSINRSGIAVCNVRANELIGSQNEVDSLGRKDAVTLDAQMIKPYNCGLLQHRV